MSFLLDALLESPLVNAPPVQSMSESSGFGRSAALLSCSELTELVSLKSAHSFAELFLNFYSEINCLNLCQNNGGRISKL